MVKGTPWSGPSLAPLLTAASAALAAARASSANTTGMALTLAFTAPIRARCASITSSELTCFFAIASASWPAPARQSSLGSAEGSAAAAAVAAKASDRSAPTVAAAAKVAAKLSSSSRRFQGWRWPMGVLGAGGWSAFECDGRLVIVSFPSSRTGGPVGRFWSGLV